ncbi:uncharacterized protein B0H18DRAFT_887415, partial [Fomitopsis serialis]|uniref:uncharacterized protein n=1 Tax=Fomitopsis serialis TaxID=139415 RepID=UPI002008B725
DSTGAGVTLVLYDHLLNLPREIQYVWQEPPLFLAICVLADVYLREAGLMYIAVAYILFRLYRIWDDRKFVKYVLGVAFVAFDLIALAMVTLSSLMTPRRPNTAIVGVLYKQGFLTFLAADTLLMPPVTWALDGVLSFRLFLKIKQVEHSSRRHWSKYDAGPRTRGNGSLGSQPTILVFEEIEMDNK